MRKDWGFGDYRRPASFVPGENRWSRSAEGEEGEEGRERPRRIEIERKKPEEGADTEEEEEDAPRISCD